MTSIVKKIASMTFIWLLFDWNLTSAVKKHNQKLGEVKQLYIDCAWTFGWLSFLLSVIDALLLFAAVHIGHGFGFGFGGELLARWRSVVVCLVSCVRKKDVPPGPVVECTWRGEGKLMELTIVIIVAIPIRIILRTGNLIFIIFTNTLDRVFLIWFKSLFSWCGM